MKVIRDDLLYRAVLHRKGEPICWFTVAGSGLAEAAARMKLAEKARNWIAEYSKRPVVMTSSRIFAVA